MRQSMYWGCIVLGSLLVGVLPAETIHSKWTGKDLDRWYDASHWSPWGIPNNSGGIGYVVTISTESPTNIDFGPYPPYVGPDQSNPGPGPQGTILDQLTCKGNVQLWIGGQTLTLLDPNGLVNQGQLTIDGDGVKHHVKGNVINQENAFLQVEHMTEIRGRVSNYGQLLVIPQAQLDADALTNSGTALMIHAVGSIEGDLVNTKTGTLRASGVLYTGGTLTNAGTLEAWGPLMVAASAGLVNQGVLKNSPMASLRMSYLMGEPKDVNNLGTIEVNAGGGIALEAPLVNKSGGAIVLRDGTLAASTIMQSAGASLQGFGTITGNLTLAPAAHAEFTGPSRLVGDLVVSKGATLEISNGTLYVSGTIQNHGTIQLKSGQIVPQARISGEGDIRNLGTP
jgi:hypothetical protein